MKRMIAGGAVALALCSTAASAEGSGFGVGVKAGMLGLGVELTKSFTPTINGRLGLNSYKFTTSGTQSDIDYNIDLKWQSTTAMIDWHPGGGSFRLSGGYVFNGNKIAMAAKPTAGGQYDLSGTTYTLDSVTGDVTFDNGLYVGLGWGNAGDSKGFGMSFEIGAMYQGSPKLKMAVAGTDAAVAAASGDLEAERKSAEDSLSNYKWYPQVALGLSYAF